ncbi:MAG TPA: amidohydrolase [Thermoanaerobaculia bacterium]|nr:amidohydrolase [Thermoanaerobaculia bacterium]
MKNLLFVSGLLIATNLGAQGSPGIMAEVDAVYPGSEALYRDLHQHPELSFHETETAARLAKELRQLGYEVTTGVGRVGVVGVLKNGAGPVVMLRTELDALPVTENTGLPFASTVRTKDDAGLEVGVMHACGHDIHMSSLVGTARIMAGSKGQWSGTLVLIGQPAEETVSGAKAMLDDGLFTRFPRPDVALAVHDDARLPSGVVGYRAGPVLTNADAVNIRIFGRGGHGARPETTVDPVVIAARMVLALQTIVSREISPLDSAVITVGSIHGGTKNNIIPDEVQLQLTVRSFTEPVRQHLLSAIERIAKAEAAAAAAPKEPLIERGPSTQALVNDPELTRRMSAVLLRELGPARAKEVQPEMASEDFAQFQLAGVPTLMLRIGAVEPARFDAAEKSGTTLPSLHSSQFAPDLEPTLKTAILVEVLALRELMPRK